VRHAVIAHQLTETNRRLVCAISGWELLSPTEALRGLREGDVALGRLDVLGTLDGVEPGMWMLGELAARGVQVLNPPAVLLACHDKLLTARLLKRASLPHPSTRLVSPGDREALVLPSEWVVKPRYGSWGRGVARGSGAADLSAYLEAVAAEPWFRRHGALVQELVEPRGYDLRIVVAGDRVTGAVTRVCADGEWRTNTALGARRLPTRVPDAAAALALAATRSIGAALVGVDLLPEGNGWTILELNAAVEFTPEYALGQDVYARTAHELVLHSRAAQLPSTRPPAPATVPVTQSLT
jgi:[lysine-biosynthesis-protein LysW]--L-2-aminoadipate ligase